MSLRVGLALLLLVACAIALLIRSPRGSDTPRSSGDAALLEAPPRLPGRWPRSIESSDGESVELEAPPKRIIATTARALEFAIDLVPPGRIAAVPEQALEYGALDTLEQAYAAHPRFSVYAAEAMLVFEPDLVLADPWQQTDTHQRLREAGVPVLVLGEVATWKQARAVLEQVGYALGAEAQASALLAEYELRVARLEGAAPRDDHLWTLAYSNFGSEGFTCGRGTTLAEIMRLAGLHNAAEPAGLEGHAAISYEKLLELDPELILVSRPIKAKRGSSGERGGAASELLYGEQSLATLRAIKGRNVLSLPASLYASASHRLVSGAEVLAAQVATWRAERMRLVLAPQ